MPSKICCRLHSGPSCSKHRCINEIISGKKVDCSSTISNSQVFLLKNASSKCKSFSHFFSKNISIYAIFDGQGFNDTLTNGIIKKRGLNTCVRRLRDRSEHLQFDQVLHYLQVVSTCSISSIRKQQALWVDCADV